jgi:hypothetical protein
MAENKQVLGIDSCVFDLVLQPQQTQQRNIARKCGDLKQDVRIQTGNMTKHTIVVVVVVVVVGWLVVGCSLLVVRYSILIFKFKNF